MAFGTKSSCNTFQMFNKIPSGYSLSGAVATTSAAYVPSASGVSNIWTDGTNIYCSNGSIATRQHILNGDTWEEKTWNGNPYFRGIYIWSDGTNIYYSEEGKGQLVLNGDTWEEKTWNGLTSFYGQHIWTDGTNIYYSYGNSQYILNGDTWETKTWNGLTGFNGSDIWTDGTNIYCSIGTSQYVLNGDTWEEKTWDGLTSFYGAGVFTDGTNIYCTILVYTTHVSYVLRDGAWESFTLPTGVYNVGIWTDGNLLYHDDGFILLPNSAKLYVKTSSSWVEAGSIG